MAVSAAQGSGPHVLTPDGYGSYSRTIGSPPGGASLVLPATSRWSRLETGTVQEQ